LDRLLFICAGVAGFVGVALGAFAAHGLKTALAPDLFAAFETGVRYQMYHAFALFAAAWASARWQQQIFAVAGVLFVAGIAIFSGSLYVLALSDTRWLGAVTPFGGLALLAGWLCLIVGAWRAKA